MKKTDQDFLNGMWDRVAQKEADIRLYEAVEDTLPNKSVGMGGFFRNAVFGLGLRELLFGMNDCLVVAMCIALMIFFFGYRLVGLDGDNVYVTAFLSAPSLYGAFFGLGWLKERQSNTYGLQMSCKYTFFHVLTARMLFAGATGLIFNLAYMIVLIAKYPADVLRLMAISFSSLMIFSLILVCFIERGKSIRNALIGVGLWMAVNAFIAWNFTTFYQNLLKQVPLALLLIVGAAAMVFSLYELAKMTSLSFRKGYTNA